MLPFTPISFVKKNGENRRIRSKSNSDDDSKPDASSIFNSAEYYNEIISQPGSSENRQSGMRKKIKRMPTMDHKELQKLLHTHIVNDDLEKLKNLITKQFPNLNRHKYNPLLDLSILIDSNRCNLAMHCASYKSLECLKYLLEYIPQLSDGIDIYGNSFFDIVKRVDDHKINKIVSSHKQHNLSPHEPSPSKEIGTSYCDVCKEHYEDPEHSMSISHVFNENRSVVEINTHMDPHNVGYKIMSNSGWNDTDGLGPTGSGKKYLIKTTLKTDRRGLGVPEKNKPRVTHFQPNDESGVDDNNIHKRQIRMKTEKKKRNKKAVQKSRQWEINLRRDMAAFE